MKITLHIVKKDELKDGKRIFEYAEEQIEMDNTMAAQMRFESCFPELAAKGSIVDYAERIRGQEGMSLPKVISALKVIFCFLEMDIPFLKFLKLFDFSQKEYTDKLIKDLKNAFDVVFDTAVEKN